MLTSLQLFLLRLTDAKARKDREMKKLKLAAFAAALTLSAAAWASVPAGWHHVGCWSPYPNCAGAKDVYQDASGNLWQCRACGTTTNPSPTSCYRSSNLNAIGYWCA